MKHIDESIKNVKDNERAKNESEMHINKEG